MSIKRTLRKMAEKLTRTHIYRNLPRGIDVFKDMATFLPNYRINVVFDVGANVGKSAESYIAKFPSTSVFCFEPVAESFQQLEVNMKGNNQVHCFQLALASSKGQGSMLSDGTSTMNRLLDETTDSTNNCDIQLEQVDILTLDDFCKDNEISHIDYLKVDTEGSDFDVLIGAEHMLREKSIDFVEVESGMNPKNTYHVPFESLKAHLERHDYFVFGLYEQICEWPTKEIHLRRANAVFVSSHVIRKHRFS
jgi:FkbM family methyltransferase